MHTWDETTDLLAYSVFGYVVERVKREKDPHWGAKPADELARSLDGAITPAGIGGHQALALFRDELLPMSGYALGVNYGFDRVRFPARRGRSCNEADRRSRSHPKRTAGSRSGRSTRSVTARLKSEVPPRSTLQS